MIHIGGGLLWKLDELSIPSGRNMSGLFRGLYSLHKRGTSQDHLLRKKDISKMHVIITQPFYLNLRFFPDFNTL